MYGDLADACSSCIIFVCRINFYLKRTVALLFASAQFNTLCSCIKIIASFCNLLSVQPEIGFSAVIGVRLFLTFLSGCPGTGTFITLPFYLDIIRSRQIQICFYILSSGIGSFSAADTCRSTDIEGLSFVCGFCLFLIIGCSGLFRFFGRFSLILLAGQIDRRDRTSLFYKRFFRIQCNLNCAFSGAPS